MNPIALIAAVLLLCNTACEKDEMPTAGNEPSTAIDPGKDPNFKIVPNTDGGFTKIWNRKVVVFGIDIYAAPKADDAKVLHAANVLAQYLDNDEDGTVDNQTVLDKLKENNAFLMIWKSESDFPKAEPKNRAGQDLGSDETTPGFVSGGKTGTFDGALEEVLHLITSAGYSQVYPDVFGETENSAIAKAMDIARGGRFLTIPSQYPSNAWYSYDDETCDYATCQVSEYHYWALTSILGAQENRLADIGDEWKLNTKAKVQQTDKAIYALMTDPQYKMPTVLPDGTYKR